MSSDELSVALTSEHHSIDAAVDNFAAQLDRDRLEPTHWHAASEALRRHIYIEEVLLFPPIREAGLAMPVQVMLREHGQLWHTMSHIDQLIADAADPTHLARICHQLLEQLAQHNAKEEPVIYPRLDTDLPAHLAAESHRVLRNGHIPDGWLCQWARDEKMSPTER